MAYAIEAKRISKKFGKVEAVRGVALVARPGEIVGLVGPNGSGKTTLIRCLCGLLRMDGGKAEINGHDVVDDGIAAREGLAFMPEVPAPFPFLTPWEHLQFVARAYRARAGWEARAEFVLRELGMQEKRDDLAMMLSKGQKQKIHLAMAMVREPTALVLDEPLIGLDPKGSFVLKRWIRERAAAGAGGIISSHSMHLVEAVCDRVVVMHRGRFIAEGTFVQLKQMVAGTTEASFEEVFIAITEGAERAEADARGGKGDRP